MKKRKILRRILGSGMILALTVSLLAGCAAKDSGTVGSQSVESETTEDESQAETAEETTQEASEAEKFNTPQFTTEEYPRVDGSTATLPLSIALYQQSTGVSRKEAEAAIFHTKTDSSYQSLAYRGTDLLLVYEASPETKEMIEYMGVPLLIKPIGKDALVFLANQGNPVDSLTGEQLVQIYSGKIKSWDQAGGKSRPIEAFQRPDNSGSQTMMKKLVMKDQEMEEAPTGKVMGEMGELVEGVAAYNNSQNALGYSVYFYAKNMYKKPELKFMAVNDVMPSNSTIKSGEYPYVNEFFAVIREDEPENSPARMLFDWLTTEDGQIFIESLGYVGTMDTTALAPTEIPAEYQVKTVDLNLNLADNERIFIPGAVIDNGPGGIFLDGHMNQEPLPEGISLLGNQVLKIDVDEPVTAIESESGLRGIYSFKEKKWLLPSEFASIYYDEQNRYYRGFMEDWRTSSWYDGDLQLIYRGDGEVVGDYIWKLVDTTHYSIVTRDGQPVKDLDFTKKKNFSFLQIMSGCMIAGYENEFEVYGPDGQLMFQKSDLPERYQEMNDISIASLSEDKKCLEFYSSKGDGNPLVSVYRLDKDQFLLDRTERGGLVIIDGVWYCQKQENNVWYYYDTDGRQILLKSGQPATLLAGNGWKGNEPEAGAVYVENKDGNKAYTLRHDLDGELEVRNLSGDYFSLSSYSANDYRLFCGGEETARRSYLYSWILDGYTVVGSYETQGQKQVLMPQIVLDGNGEIVGQTMVGEDVLYVGQGYLVTRRGSYLYLCDWDGNCGYYTLNGGLTDD